MTGALATWSKAPREAAAVWYAPGVSTFDRMVALDLVVALDGALGPVPGHLDAVINRAICGTVNRRERQNYRRAIARMQARGLLFEHDGMVYLLYSEAMWRAHRSLSEEHATPVLKVVRQPVAESAERDVNRDVNRDIKVELSARNSSTPISGERERSERVKTLSVPGGPSDPPSGVHKRPSLVKTTPPRKPSAAHAANRTVERIFNEEYLRRNPDRPASTTKDFPLLGRVATAYRSRGPDGSLGLVDERRLRGSIQRFLSDLFWVKPTGRMSAPPGHSLHAWMRNHERYDNGMAREDERAIGVMHAF